MFLEKKFLLNGKLGKFYPILTFLALGIGCLVAGYGFGIADRKINALGPIAIGIAITSYFSNTRLTLTTFTVATRWQILGIPIDDWEYHRSNLSRIETKTYSIEFYDIHNKLVRSLHGFDDQQQFEQVNAALQEWFKTALPSN